MIYDLRIMDHRVSTGHPDLTSLYEFSAVLWGNQDRFVVAAAVAAAAPGELFAQALAGHIGIPDTRVGPQLARFERVGLLVRMPKVGGERRVYFQRQNEQFWESVLDMTKAVISDSQH